MALYSAFTPVTICIVLRYLGDGYTSVPGGSGEDKSRACGAKYDHEMLSLLFSVNIIKKMCLDHFFTWIPTLNGITIPIVSQAFDTLCRACVECNAHVRGRAEQEIARSGTINYCKS